MHTTIDQIYDDFEFLDDWEDRYRYVIELGRTLPPLSEADMTEENKVNGCASQVWLTFKSENGKLFFQGDSDAHIVKGLLAILILMNSGKTPEQISSFDAKAAFAKLGLEEHLSAQRANGLASMVAKMQSIAKSDLA